MTDMDEDWLGRLKAAVESDGRSLRQISLAAGCGPNYLNQMFRDKKDPGVARFMDILGSLGTASALNVLTGADLSGSDGEFFRMMLNLKPSARAPMLELLTAMSQSEEVP
jgi:hypothetical protein